ncbi:MAG: NADH-quinone oxidoreductase subunit H [Anaerolineae bacterium]|nr:NADH-quinone oxidoreductase subunit H [Anaerolineae bacterium]MCC7190366.1 NADH-quinone oxidoreductase subunit H [Anaerolineales bacterium]
MDFLKDPLKVAADWLLGIFAGWGMPELWANVLVGFLGIFILIALLMVLDIVLVWIERKVVSRFQSRIGPNRVGPFGLIQPFADIIKLLIKEDTTPEGADRALYNLAPILSMMSVLILWAVVPLAPTILGVDLNIGVLYIIAAGAIGTLSIIMAGWSSNNKYSLIGAFREAAVMLSFEIPMLTVMLIPTIFAGSMGIGAITNAQDTWNFFLAPLAAVIFLIAAIAELGRSPFDMGEAESELISGYNIEYSGMKFGMFYAGELLHAFTFGGFWAILFFGGYRFFGLEQVSAFLAIAILFFKAFIGYWIIMWVKYTLLRIRIDHMLAFNWKFLTPVAFVLLMTTALMNALLADASNWLYIGGMFLSNILVAWISLEVARSASRRERERIEGTQVVDARQ